MQGLLKEEDSWKPAVTICGLTVGWCMLLLLGAVVLVSTTLAIVLPQQPLTQQQMTASIWQQGVGVSESGFQLEVCLVLCCCDGSLGHVTVSSDRCAFGSTVPRPGLAVGFTFSSETA